MAPKSQGNEKEREVTKKTECPNKCGELIELEKPALVPPTEDALSYLEMTKDVEGDKCFYQIIRRICPKCGYHEGAELTEEQFVKMLGGEG